MHFSELNQNSNVRHVLGISGGKDMMKWSEKNSLMNRNIDLEDVGKSGLYLLSDLSSGVTGETHYVDCGYNIVGVPKEI